MRHLGTLLLVALALLPLASPAASAENLVVQVATEPPGLDLTATPASATAAVVFFNIPEALGKVDRHGKLVPRLAQRGATTGNRNSTFFLQRGGRFHNRREKTAGGGKDVFHGRVKPA